MAKERPARLGKCWLRAGTRHEEIGDAEFQCEYRLYERPSFWFFLHLIRDRGILLCLRQQNSRFRSSYPQPIAGRLSQARRGEKAPASTCSRWTTNIFMCASSLQARLGHEDKAEISRPGDYRKEPDSPSKDAAEKTLSPKLGLEENWPRFVPFVQEQITLSASPRLLLYWATWRELSSYVMFLIREPRPALFAVLRTLAMLFDSQRP